MQINYRKATIADKQVLFDLGVLLNTFNLDHDIKEELFWDGWEVDVEKEVIEELNDPTITIYFAETEDKQPVGYIAVKNCEHCGRFEVDQLFIKEEFRGKEVGKKLLDLVAKEAKKLGLSIQLEVYKSNERAINFYKKYGFKDDGVILRLDP